MSWATQNWAMRQKPDHPSDKFVLIGMASLADANHCAYPSIGWLVEFTGYDRKTVIDALQRLAGGLIPLIADTGERKGRTKQVRVYRLAVDVAGSAATGNDPETGTVPKPEPYPNRNSSGFSAKQSRKRDTEPLLEPIPPCSPDGEQTPKGVAAPISDDDDGKGEKAAPAGRSGQAARQGTRLPDDWTAPPVADLPPMARKSVAQWPAGAYEAVAATFACHWQGESGPRAVKRDWTAALGKWLLADHARIMRDARAGVSFAHLAPADVAAGGARALPRPVAAKAREDKRSAAIHAALGRELGARLHDQWLAPAAVIVDPQPSSQGGRVSVTVIVASAFHRGWLEERFDRQIRAAVATVTGISGAACRVGYAVETQGGTSA